MRSCTLILGEGEFSEELRGWCGERFEVKEEREARRWEGWSGLVEEVDFIFNFMGPVILTNLDLSKGAVNLNWHPGPPEHPGVGCASYGIYEGRGYGVTCHEMVEEVDAGRIVEVKRFPIKEGESCEALFERAIGVAAEQFKRITEKLAKGWVIEWSKETWKRKAVTRKEFEAWMDVTGELPSIRQRKEAALKHSRFDGPYIMIDGGLDGVKYWRKAGT